jgi:AraC-like DNA-binding protein
MAENAQTLAGTEQSVVPRIWRTTDVAEEEAFEFYRDGICSAFMPLRPELDRPMRRSFRADVRSYEICESTLNLVTAHSHDVHKGRGEIAASPQECFYVNYQVRGCCEISQRGRTVALHPGAVGIFDSGASFHLNHEKSPVLTVASLMVPKQVLRASGPAGGEPGPALLSAHGVYGPLVAETMKSLTECLPWASQADVAELKALLVHLIGLAVSAEGTGTPSGDRPQAQLYRIKGVIRARCGKPGYSVAECAAEVGVSERYIHRLFELDEDRFGTFLLAGRLNSAARMLNSPAHACKSLSVIATESGFRDQSHFFRTFRQRFGMTPLAWRTRPRASGGMSH